MEYESSVPYSQEPTEAHQTKVISEQSIKTT
jgi:hypothetical protein